MTIATRYCPHSPLGCVGARRCDFGDCEVAYKAERKAPMSETPKALPAESATPAVTAEGKP